MDLDRVFSQMDYIGGDAKEAKSGVGTTEDRLDSGLDSLKDEEYQAVTAELTQLRVECSRPQQKQPTSVTGDEHKWREQITEDGDT